MKVNTLITEEDMFWFDAAVGASYSSHDRHSRVGCIVLAQDGQIIITANRMPEGVNPNREERYEREEKKFWIEHAELSAIFKASSLGIKLRGATLYCTRFPCDACARGIVGSRIGRVIVPEPEIEHPRWGGSFQRSCAILGESMVDVLISGPRLKQEDDPDSYFKSPELQVRPEKRLVRLPHDS